MFLIKVDSLLAKSCILEVSVWRGKNTCICFSPFEPIHTLSRFHGRLNPDVGSFLCLHILLKGDSILSPDSFCVFSTCRAYLISFLQSSPAWSRGCLQLGPLFLLQPPHVINHVKWQKAQHCQVCEGDLMELKMGCFVVVQFILCAAVCLLCFHPALRMANSPSFARRKQKRKVASILSKDPHNRKPSERVYLVFVVLNPNP